MPRIKCGEQKVPLRAKEARAILAYLLLPARVFLQDFTPLVHSRKTLAKEFWKEKDDPRVHLRQALASLKKTFGSGCFLMDDDSVQIAPGTFITDLHHINEAYGHARVATTPEDRLHFLIEAEGYIGGPFLEACLESDDCAISWFIRRRSEVHGWIATILNELAKAYEEAGNPNAAMDVAQRVVSFQPHFKEARERVWRLSEQTGQEAALHTLKDDYSFEEAMEHITTKDAVDLTSNDTRLLQALYQEKIETLDSVLQQALPRLAFFTVPFPALLAQKVARVPHTVLNALSQTELVKRSGDLFALSKAAQLCAGHGVSFTTRQRQEKRLALFCEAWVKEAIAERGNYYPLPIPPPFTTLIQAEPFVQISLNWLLNQPPTLERLYFIEWLIPLGLIDIACTAVSYLDRVSLEEDHVERLRCVAGTIAAHLLFDKGNFAEAIVRLERALFLSQDDELSKANLESLLSQAYHYSGNSQAALVHLRLAETFYERQNIKHGLAGCLRFRAEIQNHLGNTRKPLLPVRKWSL